jgi:hypothetical protein
MNDFLLQIMLAQRNDETGTWMQILVFVVLAAFWLAGGVIKARSHKRGSQNEQSPRKPGRKPPVHSSQAREQMLSRLPRPVGSAQGQQQQPQSAARKPRMKFADLQAAVRKFAVEAEQAFQADAKESSRQLETALTERQIMAEKGELTSFVSKTVKGLQDNQTSESTKTPGPEYLSEILNDCADPEALRRAILYYEILGKPLTLRESSDY